MMLVALISQLRAWDVVIAMVGLFMASAIAQRMANKGPMLWPVFGILPGLFANVGNIYEWITDALNRCGGTFPYRGVWFGGAHGVITSDPANVEYLLKTRFDRPMGLADENVMILDPACGTGTFLYFVIQEIHDTVVRERGGGAWNSYVREKLLPRIFGFELLMAPYAMAHMKLALQLQELGYDFQGDERLGIYLTNSLEEAITKAETLGFARFISEEADAAADIKKEKPIMVVLGNPPYSVSSANKGEHIERLMERYKEAVRDERNIQPLSDDYIKFIRFAHDRIERTGYGIVGMIANHSYLSGLIHRGMREELLKSFDQIKISL